MIPNDVWDIHNENSMSKIGLITQLKNQSAS